MERSVLYAIGICIAAAAFEGVCAGGGVRQRLARLRQPSFSLPFWAWMIVGGLYYLICFLVLSRLLSRSAGANPDLALGLLASIMVFNGLWNLLFFRLGSPFLSFLLSVPYSVTAVALLVLLIRVDPVAAWCFLPYTVYLAYANAWGYAVWRRNRSPVDGPGKSAAV